MEWEIIEVSWELWIFNDEALNSSARVWIQKIEKSGGKNQQRATVRQEGKWDRLYLTYQKI